MKWTRWAAACIRIASGFVLVSAAAAQPYWISSVAGGAPVPTPVPAVSASISPVAVAAAPSGNVYFTSRNAVYKLDSGGLLTRIAGSSRPGFSGDGGLAVEAQLNSPSGLALDPSGNIYIADTGNGCVRRVSSAGLISTVAGDPSSSIDPGDGVPATQAVLGQPFAVVFDSGGNLYIADNSSVREVSPNGIVRTIAGCAPAACDNRVPQLTPTALALDSTGAVYIAEYNRVVELTAASLLITIAGSANVTGGYSGEGGPATQAVLGRVNSLAWNASGELFLADALNGRILEVAKDGTISTAAGNGSNISAGDGGPAKAAGISGPNGLAFDAAGNLYVAELGAVSDYVSGIYLADSGKHIRKIAATGTITTVAGNGTTEYSGDEGGAAAAQLDAPWGVAVDPAGNLYVSDSGNHTVRQIAPTGLITTAAGTGFRGSKGDGGPATSAQLNVPLGIAADGAGNLYVAECLGARVRKITPAGMIMTVAGNGVSGYGGDGGPAASAQLACPHGVAVDASGTLYIADTGNHRLRKVGPDGTISTIAGNGVQGFSGDGKPALDAQLYAPTSLAIDTSGNLYIADTGNNRIREISKGGAISTVAGCADSSHFSSDDGQPATAAALSGPQGVAVDASGNLYIAETQGNHVRRVSPDGVISTIAGRALYGYLAYFDGNLDIFLHGYTGDAGPSASARLGSPYGLAVDSSFNVYVADLPNAAVRMLQPSPIANAASVLPGPIAAGQVVTLDGSGLGPAVLTVNPPDAAGAVSSEIAGTQVLFDGVAAPVLYTSATQVAALVPAIAGSQANVEVRYQGATAAQFTVPVAASAPALFTFDSSGRGLAAALDQDHSYNSFTSSASLGDTVKIFATGLGASPSAVTVTIGGVPAEILEMGPAPGQLGVTEMDVKVPMDALAATKFNIGGDVHVPVSVMLQVGDATSQPGVYITVYITVLG